MADNSGDNKLDLGAEGIDLEQITDKPKDDKGKDVDFNLDDFFSTLDYQVNRAAYDNEPPEPSPAPDKEEPAETQKVSSEGDSTPASSDEVEGLRKELEALKKRYSDSSSEGKRLADENKELSEYREYIPLLKAMGEDPGLISHVRNYLEGKSAPVSVKEELRLPEDFVFDGDEAVNNPDSDSAKVLQSMISKGVEHRLKSYTQQQQATHAQERQIAQFQSEMKLDDGEMSELVNWAKSRPLTLKDIYYLKNRESREKAIAKQAVDEKEKQLKKMQDTPKSMASTGAHAEPVDEEKEIFEAIKRADGGMNIFGG